MRKGMIKAAVPIRTLLITIFVVSIFIYGAFLTFGGISLNNNIPLNASLKAQYNNVSGNQSFPQTGTLSYLASLNKLAGGQQNGTTNVNNAFNPGTSVNLAAGYFGSLGNIYNNIILFIATGLNFVGIPTAFVQGIANIALIIIIFLAILSAIFLFPI